VFAIAFDLVVAETLQRHPKGVTQAYLDIESTLARRGFNRVQRSLYATGNEDMANLFQAIVDLSVQPWFPESVRDLRAFRIEQWSDFTGFIKRQPAPPSPTKPPA
jgi:virulence-associated protein VapD